jgi:hypothetical protein
MGFRECMQLGDDESSFACSLFARSAGERGVATDLNGTSRTEPRRSCRELAVDGRVSHAPRGDQDCDG